MDLKLSDKLKTPNAKRNDIFDFQKALSAGNRLSNVTNNIYKLFNGFDSFERHFLAASFIKEHRFRTVLDVGGLKGKLDYFLSSTETSIDVANLGGKADIIYDGKTIPVSDNSFDCVISLDVLEHVPSEDRLWYLSELIRVTNRFVFLSMPYKTELHNSIESRIFGLFRQARKSDHKFLKEHIENGLIDENDFSEYVDILKKNNGDIKYQLFYSGNIIELAKPIEDSLKLKIGNKALYLLKYPFFTFKKTGLGEKLTCGHNPNPETNRMFIIISKSGGC